MCKPTFNKSRIIKSNAMLKVRPELFYEWDFKENELLGLNVYEVTKGMNKLAGWHCKLGHKWKALINNRVKGAGCPYCSPNPKCLKGFNDMWTTNPTQASWLLNPVYGYKYTQSSSKRVDWKCPDCSLIIKNKLISDVTRYGLSCSMCSDGIPYPEKVMCHLLRQLKIKFEHDRPRKWSKNKRYDFYIPSLSAIIETHGGQHSGKGFKTIGGRTFEEEQANDKYKYEMAKEHGIKHYIVIDCSKSDLDLIKKNILNSELVKLFDLSNIDWNEIELNSQNSIKIEILELWRNNHTISEICDLLNIHYSTVNRALRLFSKLQIIDDYTKKICQLDYYDLSLIKIWNSEKEIKDFLKCGLSVIRNVCNGYSKSISGYRWMYFDDYEKYKNGELDIEPIISTSYDKVKVVQIDLEGRFIKEWTSITDASKSLNIEPRKIARVCNGEHKTTGGFAWIYNEDYKNKLLKNMDLKIQLKTNARTVVKLDNDLNYIGEFDSIKTAGASVNTNNTTAISGCCRGSRKTAYGYKWMYKEDYENLIVNK